MPRHPAPRLLPRVGRPEGRQCALPPTRVTGRPALLPSRPRPPARPLLSALLLFPHLLPLGALSAPTRTSRHPACGRWDLEWRSCPLPTPGRKGSLLQDSPPGSATGGPSAQILRMRDTLLPRCTSHLIDPGCCLGHRAPIRLQWKTDGLCSRAKSGG